MMILIMESRSAIVTKEKADILPCDCDIRIFAEPVYRMGGFLWEKKIVLKNNEWIEQFNKIKPKVSKRKQIE